VTSCLTSSPRARAIELIAAVERLVPELSAADQLEVHNALVPLWRSLHHLLLTETGLVATSREQPDPLLTLAEAAIRLRRSRSWLFHNWKRFGLGFRDGGRVRFQKGDLDRYVNTQRRGL
jgi:hypothetical protein